MLRVDLFTPAVALVMFIALAMLLLRFSTGTESKTSGEVCSPVFSYSMPFTFCNNNAHFSSLSRRNHRSAERILYSLINSEKGKLALVDEGQLIIGELHFQVHCEPTQFRFCDESHDHF